MFLRLLESSHETLSKGLGPIEMHTAVENAEPY